MREIVKCPACADVGQQERMGFVSLDNQTVKQPPPALYRCGACDFLYMKPKLEGSKQADGRQ